MRLYRLLLHLYPAAFQAEYADEMAADFAARQLRAPGLAARAALWIGAISDVARNALAVHADLLRQDLKHAGRVFRRAPGFAATVVAVAALGIGATTAAFSLADRVLIRPLPFPEASRLVKLWEEQSYRGFLTNDVSPANFRDWKRLGSSLEGMSAYSNVAANLAGSGPPERLEGALVTHDLFSTLRIAPAVGRDFRPEDDRPGAARTVVLSDGLWKRRFGADRDVLGRAVLLDEVPYTVIGVMPPDFAFPTPRHDYWRPYGFSEESFVDRTDTYLSVVARLKPGVSVAAARAQMAVVAAALARENAKTNARTGVTLLRLRDDVTQRGRLLVTILFGASLGLLLIACSNLANLLLARATSRRGELALRSALGAARPRLLRQLMTENVLLAGAGGAGGILLAIACVPLGLKLMPAAMPIAGSPGVDLRVLAFAALLTMATGVAFGVAPALHACAGTEALGSGGRVSSDRRAERLRSLLVVAEVTACLALLVCSGLLIRALGRLEQIDPGFRRENVLTLRTTLAMPKYEPTAPRVAFYDRVLVPIRALPGVARAAYTTSVPMLWGGGIWPVRLDGEPDDPMAARMASLRYVTPQYFAALGIPLRRGRDVADSDTRNRPSVAVVSESFARLCWPGEDPIGKRFHFAFQEPTIVGIAGDVRVRGPERESEPQVYLSARQVADGQTLWYYPKDLVVRSTREPSALLPEIRRIVGQADPLVPISDVHPLSDIVDGQTGPRRLQIQVLGAFAAAALLLAAIGIHGLLAFHVSQRSREIGVRVALGAERRDILRLVLGQAARLAAAGAVIGVFVAYASARAMRAALAGVSPADAATFASAAAAVLLAALAGSLLPALRASRLDPRSAIRTD